MKIRILVAIVLTVTMTAALAGSASAAPLPVTEPFDGTPGVDISDPVNGSGWTWIGGSIDYDSTLVDAGNSGYVAGAPAGGYDYRKYFATDYTLAPGETAELTVVARMPTAGTGWPENLGIEILSPTSVGEPGAGGTGEYMQISFDRDAAASPNYSTYSYIGLWDSPGSPWSSLTTPITSGDTLTMKITTDAHKALIQYDAGSGWVTVDDQNFGYGTISGVKLFGNQTLGFYDSVLLEIVEVPVLPGDTDGDGDVDGDDAAILASFWQQTGLAGGASEGDFNGDGAANDIDATIMAANWTGPSAASVPEPSTLILLIVGALALLCVKPRRS